MALPPLLNKIVGWLRAGYPEGVPSVDYIPLFALLGMHLSDEEVERVADELASSSDPASGDAIKKAITALTNTKPLDSDIDRVRARLAAGQNAGELPDNVDIDALAGIVTATLYGLAIKARDGAPRARLRALVDQLMAMWPGKANAPPSRQRIGASTRPRKPSTRPRNRATD